MADKYKNWDDLAAHEDEGTDYEIRVNRQHSHWAHLAYHGGTIELLTAELAQAVAEDREQNFYALVGKKKPPRSTDLRITGIHYDEPQCVKMQKAVRATIAYHGVAKPSDGDPDEIIYLGGAEPATGGYRTDIAKNLKAKGFKVKQKAQEYKTDDPKNIVNRNKNKKGVHLELTRALRDTMSASGNANDLSQGYSQRFHDFVDALTPVTGPADVYQSWESLTKVEKEGEDYELEITRRGSAYSHLAIHGGKMELLTSELAKTIARRCEQNIYSLTGIKKKHNDRMRIPSTKYDEPKAVKLQSEVDFSISYHGVGDRKGDPKKGIVRVGGRQAKHRDWIIKALKDRGIHAEKGGIEGQGDHDSPDNIVNRNRQRAGVQIELSRALRNAMAASGDASDLSQGTTDLFNAFVEAVSGVTVATDRHQSWESFTANETEGEHYRLDYRRNPESDVAHLAIHGGPMECMTTSLADQAAARKDQNFYSLVSIRKQFHERLRMPSTVFAEPTALELQKAVYFTFSYHGISDRDDEPDGGVVYVGGMDVTYRDEAAKALTKKGFTVRIGGVEWNKAHIDNDAADNITNKNRQPGGVQFELTRTLRNRMSSTGNACDEDAKKTQAFHDFLSAVRSVSSKPDAPERESGEQKCIRYLINGFDLNQSRRGFKLLKDTEYAPALAPRLFNLPIPSWHGQVPMWHDPLDVAKATFQVQIMGRTTSELRQRWDHFVSLCGAGKFAPVKLERYRGIYLTSDTEYDPHDRNLALGEYAHARLESLTAPEFEAGSQQLTATAVFQIPVGVWRSHKVYYQYYAGHGAHQKCVVAKVSSAPVYAVVIRVQGGPDLASWALVDEHSQTGVAWTIPAHERLKDGDWVYADTNTMRAYIARKRDWPHPDESFAAFIHRIKGKAAWSDFRYVRNGPLSLTARMAWDKKKKTLGPTSGVFVSTTNRKGTAVAGHEMAIMARAARI